MTEEKVILNSYLGRIRGESRQVGKAGECTKLPQMALLLPRNSSLFLEHQYTSFGTMIEVNSLFQFPNAMASDQMDLDL